jgi:predicted DNA-binding transcriptional regulator AlpA
MPVISEVHPAIPTRPRKPRAPKARRRAVVTVISAGKDPDEKLTLAQVCAELKITRSTFYDWRAKGRAPRTSKLRNGEIRIVRRDLDDWYASRQVTKARRRAAVPAASGGKDPDEKLTLAQVCAELKITRSTFYDWRAKGRAPRCTKLPNGEIRIVRRDLEEWYASCQAA